MNKEKYLSLIYQKLKGDISLEEQSVLDIWIGQSADNEQLVKNMERDWQITEQYEPELEIDLEADFELLQQRIQKDMIQQTQISVKKDNLRIAHQPIGKVVDMSSKKSNTRWLGWAAAAVFALAFGFWFLNGNDSSTISNLALETQFGEKKTVQLADGTKIWLNGTTKLEYPATFERNSRVVKLTGEAFFEVAKNAQKPFVIETNKAKITVLGTSFNVRARIAEKETEVLVRTGKVRLENAKGNKKIELIANQKGVYNASSHTIEQFDEKDMNDLGWYNEILVYSSTPLEEVITDLSRQFSVNISLVNPIMKTCELDARLKTTDGISSILKAIASDFEMEYKKRGNTTFELSGGRCQ